MATTKTLKSSTSSKTSTPLKLTGIMSPVKKDVVKLPTLTSNSTAAPKPAAIPTPTPKTTTLKTASSGSSPSGWSNVKDVLAAPWKGESLLVGRKNIPVVSPALSALTGFAEVGSVAYLGALAAGKAATSFVSTGGISAGISKLGGLFTPVAAALTGFGVGSLTGGQKNAASQAQPFEQKPQQTQGPTTQTPTIDARQWTYAQDYSDRRSWITGSPGASIEQGGQTTSPSLNPVQDTGAWPSQAQTTTGEPSQGLAQGSDNKMLLYAGLALLAYGVLRR